MDFIQDVGLPSRCAHCSSIKCITSANEITSKPNIRMIKMNTIGVMVMVYSIIGKKSSRPGCRAEHRATDSRLQTRRKRASRTLEGLHLSSCYFLKRSKTDISQSVKSIPRFLGAAPGRPFRDVGHFSLLGDDSSPVPFGLHLV